MSKVKPWQPQSPSERSFRPAASGPTSMIDAEEDPHGLADVAFDLLRAGVVQVRNEEANRQDFPL